MREISEVSGAEESRIIIDMVTTIMVYKLEQLSPNDIKAMLDIPIQETRFYREVRQEGRQEGEKAAILRLLHKRLGDIPVEAQAKISKLSLAELESLSDTLLEFATVMDLQTWLDKQ
ncbi:MAG: DUF4351 domain-containing protein [Cyanobacteria bacterium J06621_3]